MTHPLTLENAQAVVMYKYNDVSEDGLPLEAFKWSTIEHKTKSYFEVQGVRFSYKTGKPVKNQPQDYSFLWRAPTSNETEQKHYSDVVVKVEPFDMNELETKHVENQKVEFYILDEEQTVEEMLNEFREHLKLNDIPMDARIVRVDGDEIFVSYERPETLDERTDRIYRQPAIEREKQRQEQEKLEKRRQELLEELNDVESQMS